MLNILSGEDILDENSVKKISQLVHFSDKKVKEEAGQLLLVMSDVIDDPSDLLEI